MTIHQKFTGDNTQLLKCYQDQAKELARQEQLIAKLGASMRGAGNQGGAAQLSLNNLTRQGMKDLQSYIAQWGTLTGVLAAVKMELDDVHARQDRARDTNIGVGGSQADVVRNLPSKSRAERQAFLAEANRSFADSGFPDLKEYNRALAAGLSASSEDTVGTLRATKAAARLTRDKPQELDMLVGAALDIRKASGEQDAENNLSFMLQVGAESRMPDTRQNARNVPSAIISATNTMKGDRRQAAIDAGAVFAALGTQAGDERGEGTSTSVTSFAVQTRDFFEKGIEKTINGHKFRQRPKVDPGTFEGRISYLQQNERDRKRFLESTSFERKFQSPIEQLLMPGSETDKQFRLSRGKIGFDPSTYRSMTRDLADLTPAMSAATTDAAAKGNTQLTQLASTRESRIALSRQIYQDALAETRQYSSMPFGAKFLTDVGTNTISPLDDALSGRSPIQTAMNRLEARQKEITMPGALLGGKDMLAARRDVNQLSKEEREKYDYLGKQLSRLSDLLEEQMREDKAEKAGKAPTLAPTAARAERGGHREQ